MLPGRQAAWSRRWVPDHAVRAGAHWRHGCASPTRRVAAGARNRAGRCLRASTATRRRLDAAACAAPCAAWPRSDKRRPRRPTRRRRCSSPRRRSTSAMLETGRRRLGAIYQELQPSAWPRWLDWHGPVFTVSTACTSALNAVLAAARPDPPRVRPTKPWCSGSRLANRFTVGRLRRDATARARQPRSPWRAIGKGLVLGEAVAALHLTSQPARWQHRRWRQRGRWARPGRHRCPRPCSRCANGALAQSGLPPGDIDADQAAGGRQPRHRCHRDGSAAAACSIRCRRWCRSRPSIGHTLGAAGAAELRVADALPGNRHLAADPGRRGSRARRRARQPSAGARTCHVFASILGSAAAMPPSCSKTWRPRDERLAGHRAHVAIDPLPADWRDQLAARLGARPRRLGAWTELAMFGALRCLDAAGETALPAGRAAACRQPARPGATPPRP